MLFYSALAIINQAIKHHSTCAKIPYSKKGFELVKLLYKLGYLNSYYLDYQTILIDLKWYQNKLVLNGFFFHTKPSHTRSISFSQLKRVFLIKNKLFILSTPYGICTTYDALRMHQGGVIIAEIQ